MFNIAVCESADKVVVYLLCLYGEKATKGKK